MITWWTWTTLIILVFHVSCFNSLESLMDIVQHISTPHPPGRTTLVVIFYTLLSFINLGKFITYQYWILWSRSTHSCFPHPWPQWLCDWNIQSCHRWWRHPWLQSSWQIYQSKNFSQWKKIVAQIWLKYDLKGYYTIDKNIIPFLHIPLRSVPISLVLATTNIWKV